MMVISYSLSLVLLVLILTINQPYCFLIFYTFLSGTTAIVTITQYIIISESMSENYKQMACPFVYLGSGLS